MSDQQDPADKEHFGEASLGDAQAENAPNDPEMLTDSPEDAGGEITDVPALEPAPVDALEIEAEEEAAALAGAIGGITGQEGIPDEQRALVEAGEGEAEGFEQAEALLIDHATHAEPGGDPLADRFTPENADSEGLSVYGEADHVDIGEDDVEVSEDARSGDE